MPKDDGLVPVVLLTLRMAGWWAERLPSGTAHSGRMHMARAGSPDVVAIRPGTKRYDPPLPMLVECKHRTGKLRRAQVELSVWCAERGILYVVVRSVDDVAKLVEGGAG